MKQYLIAPSILSADFARLGEATQAVIDAGADIIHFDVMDNHYVPNLTIGPMVCQALRDYGITKTIDVHLMVEPVDSMIQAFIKAGADMISFHPEASKHVDRSLAQIKDAGLKAGLVLNPATPIESIQYVLDKLDFVLVMSVNPGFGGQQFIPSTLKKIADLSQFLKNNNKHIDIAVDGGVDIDNIGQITKHGANIFIAGSAIFKSKDYAKTIKAMRDNIAGVLDEY